MKYFLLFLFLSYSIYAQTGKIVYTSVFNFEGNQVNKTENNLFFTNNASFYQAHIKSNKKTQSDEKGNEELDESKLIEININVGTDSIGNIYYHNLRSYNIICRAAMYENRDTKYYIYEDNTNIKWQLVDDSKEISGYRCQKATTKFRGRNYEAWFTTEIPLSFGPWKFYGLPGLILEVYDLTGEVYFSAEQIQIPYTPAEEKVRKPEDDPILSHREFIEKGNENTSKITQAMLARLPKGANLVSTEIKKNGIELEYEWDKE